MALEPIVWRESTSTSDAFTNIAAVDRFNLNVPATDEIEHPERSAGIAMMYAGSATGSGDIEEVRTEISSLREPTDMYLGQVHDDVTPGSWPFPLLDLQDNPINPGVHERLKVEAKGADGGTPEAYAVCFMLDDGAGRSIPSGPRRRVFFDGDSAPGSANAWNRIGISLDQTLQNGVYEVIGAQVRHADGLAFGFDFDDRTGVYGGFCVPDEHAPPVPFQQPGALGSGWGQFRDEAPPDLVIFGDGTTDDIEGHIDIVGPVGGGGT